MSSNIVNPRAKITTGKDDHFYEQLTVSLSDFGDADGYCNVLILSSSPSNMILSVDSGGSVQYSFNGTTTHGTLVGSTPRALIQFNFCKRKIWFKGSGTVDVEAW